MWLNFGHIIFILFLHIVFYGSCLCIPIVLLQKDTTVQYSRTASYRWFFCRVFVHWRSLICGRYRKEFVAAISWSQNVVSTFFSPLHLVHSVKCNAWVAFWKLSHVFRIHCYELYLITWRFLLRIQHGDIC